MPQINRAVLFWFGAFSSNTGLVQTFQAFKDFIGLWPVSFLREENYPLAVQVKSLGRAPTQYSREAWPTPRQNTLCMRGSHVKLLKEDWHWRVAEGAVDHGVLASHRHLHLSGFDLAVLLDL